MDQLRKEALRLEHELESKLVSYTKLTSNTTSRNGYISSKENGGGHGSSVEAMGVEVEGILVRLQEVVQKMSGNSGGGGGVQVERHVEILRDYTLEFRRARQGWVNAKEHGELLAGARIDLGKGFVGGGGGGDDGELLYKERKSVGGANMAAEGAIGAGLNLREDLERQRAMFASMMGRMENMSEGVPAINRVISMIRRRRRRDVFVMAGVVGFLLFVTIVLFNR